ncbi:TIGR04255 family protein [Pengzhenrongella sicca]|uniref:TIGR04255 family protein n=1 Tax=Pengzhenrongella sicca TaxID=2819238 RepID=A0A8A4ZFS9_9MICO|nr:TIGR04255 family protein [Pengzhenrongella sicca]QTE29347.1 TIGR04255 family protein [Pengzhenrongella sicca]
MLAAWYQPKHHPKFANPPVIESAMALEFAPIEGLDLYRLMRLQEVWDADYPNVSDVPGAPPTPVGNVPQNMFFIGEAPKRVWAAAVENGLLVQTQADRLILNWRKSETIGAYPGYQEKLRPELFRLWDLMAGFAEANAWPLPRPTLAEFTYVNAVEMTGSDRPEDYLTIFQDANEHLPGVARQMGFQLTRAVTASESDPFTAELHVAGETQFGPDERRRLQFTVTARVLLDAGKEDLQAAMDAAHGLASYTFASIVTPSKQSAWNRLPQ